MEEVGGAVQLDVLVAVPFMLYFYVIFFSLMQINLKLQGGAVEKRKTFITDS